MSAIDLSAADRIFHPPDWEPSPNGETVADDAPVSVPTDAAPYSPFPLDALPPVMSEFAAALARTVCVDPSLAALPMLSVAGACIGNAARARMNADYDAPANVWTCGISRSGERKSPILRAVMRPIYDAQGTLAAEHSRGVAEYQSAMEQWKALPKKERGDSPLEPPPFPHLYLSDATTEAIAIRLAEQPRGLAVVMDELAALFSGMNQYRAKGGHDRESYLAFYDAGPAKIDRKSAIPPVIYIPRAFVAVTGMIQPGVLARSLGASEYDSGMAARFLMAAPPPMRATWTDEGIPDASRDGWRDLLAALLAHPLPENPALIAPTTDAMRRWAQTHDRLEAERHAEPDDRMRAARAKLIGAIPRLALIFQMVSAASGEKGAAVRSIDDLSMRRAVDLVEWFGREARRVYGMLAGEGDGGSEDSIIQWIEQRGGEVTPRDLARHARNFRGVDAAQSYLDSLAQDGVGRWVYRQQRTRGRPSRVFILL